MDLIKKMREAAGFENGNQYAKALNVHSEVIYRLENRTTSKQMPCSLQVAAVQLMARETGRSERSCALQVYEWMKEEFGAKKK